MIGLLYDLSYNNYRNYVLTVSCDKSYRKMIVKYFVNRAPGLLYHRRSQEFVLGVGLKTKTPRGKGMGRGCPPLQPTRGSGGVV